MYQNMYIVSIIYMYMNQFLIVEKKKILNFSYHIKISKLYVSFSSFARWKTIRSTNPFMTVACRRYVYVDSCIPALSTPRS